MRGVAPFPAAARLARKPHCGALLDERTGRDTRFGRTAEKYDGRERADAPRRRWGGGSLAAQRTEGGGLCSVSAGFFGLSLSLAWPCAWPWPWAWPVGWPVPVVAP